jgi:protein-disulfide isomerase
VNRTRWIAALAISLWTALAGAATTAPRKAAAANATPDAPVAAITTAQADQILAELHAIKAMLEEDRKAAGEPAAGTVKIPDVALQVLGAADAPVTLVEFTDYQCPYCHRFHEQSWPEIKKNYVDTGKVRFIVRDLPLDFHEQALPAALAARCAGAQDRYWPMYEALLSQKDALTRESSRRLAMAAGVDLPTFDACMQNPGLRHAIENDIAEAVRIGVNGTPGFLIAQRREGQLEGTLLLGAQPAAAFAARIDALLAGR